MAGIAIHARITAAPDRLGEIRRLAAAIVARAGTSGSGVTRCDWFVSEARHECVAMIEHASNDSLLAHHATTAAGDHYRALLTQAGGAMDVLGTLTDAARNALGGYERREYAYADGLGSAAAVRGPAAPIEIYTGFAIQPGQLALFRRYALELTDVVRAGDPGTARYDWFYDDAHDACIALDTYVDSAAMFTHMKNCHAAHEKLLKLSTMTTEFLGELPPEAMQAVSKYSPYVLRYLCGLRS
jgi:quinol monooxygenase YgiN